MIYIDLRKDYFTGIVNLVGMIHGLARYRVSYALDKHKPKSVRDIWDLLESIGFKPYKNTCSRISLITCREFLIMLVLVSYDIENDKTRTKLANKLKDFGPRVQYSVFEADLKSGDELKKLAALLEKTELENSDSIRLYQICETCVGKIKIWGVGDVTRDKDFYIA